MRLRGGTCTCLGQEVVEYVDGALTPAEQLRRDRHLAVCSACRDAVAAERRLRGALRAGPRVPDDLRSMLLSLSQEIPIQPVARPKVPADRAVPAVPRPDYVTALFVAHGPQLVVLAPDAPAQHRSPLRAAVVATAAAGASMAAVWGFALAPASVARVPAAQTHRLPAAATQTTRPTVAPALFVPRAAATEPVLGAQSSP